MLNACQFHNLKIEKEIQMITEASTLDEWYYLINKIYLQRNYHRSPESIFMHLVEVVGGLSSVASGKKKQHVTLNEFVPKAIAWWMALAGKLGITSVESMIWSKFPYCCPYCAPDKHEDRSCKRTPGAKVNWERLAVIGTQNEAKKPKNLGGWQQMFADIYQHKPEHEVFARLAEELGELGEAVRAFPVNPGYVLSEASDVFAWLMHLQTAVELHGEGVIIHGKALNANFYSVYPGKCKDCGKRLCQCPAILPSTLGRIAKESSKSAEDLFRPAGLLMRPDEAIAVFEIGATEIRLDNEKYNVNEKLLSVLVNIVNLINQKVTQISFTQTDQGIAVLDAVYGMRQLLDSQRITQQAIEDMRHAFVNLSNDERESFRGLITSLGAGIAVEIGKYLLGIK